jgi:hypothetical protein
MSTINVGPASGPAQTPAWNAAVSAAGPAASRRWLVQNVPNIAPAHPGNGGL